MSQPLNEQLLKQLLKEDGSRLNDVWLRYWNKSEVYSRSNPTAWAHAVIDWLAMNGYEVRRQEPKKPE